MKEQITLGNHRYTVQLECSNLAHLCTGIEVNNFELFVEKHNPQFDSYTSIATDEITEAEFDLLTHMFAQLVNRAIGFADNGKYAILAMNTGNASEWEYTLIQRDKFTPILDRLSDKTSMVLYSEDADSCEYFYGDKDDAYVEVTMFTIPQYSVDKIYSQNIQALQDAVWKEPEPTSLTTLTETTIRQYLRDNHAA